MADTGMLEAVEAVARVGSSSTNGLVDKGSASTKSQPRKRRKKGRKGARAKTHAGRSDTDSALRAARAAPFPRTTFEDALFLGTAIQTHAAGQKIRRSTLFEKLDKSPDSGPSRQLVTNSSKYGITTGGYKSEFLELTELGARATSPESNDREKQQARFELAIKRIPPFNFLYDSLKEKRIPSPEVMRDSLADPGVEEAFRKECVELFLENAKYLKLLRTSAGAERLASIEQVLEGLNDGRLETRGSVPEAVAAASNGADSGRPEGLDRVCFVIAPIDDDGTEKRKHSDMVLESLISRALEREDLTVVRADRIGDPGMISGQVINYLLRSKLVIADLSFHNPNVFYELAIRHMTGRPTVHLIRGDDFIPFDSKDFRTIVIDTSDKYDLVAKLDTYRAEIANHVRIAVTSGGEGSNPIRTFAPNLVVKID